MQAKVQQILIGVLLLPALTCSLYLVKNYAVIKSACQRNLDRQLIALAVEQADSFEAFTGAYSKAEFRHPGPAYFYYLAAARKFLPDNISPHAAYKLATIAFNFAALLTALAIAARVFPGGAQLTPLLFAAFMLSIFSPRKVFLLGDYWNPSIIPSLFLIFILALICFSLRRAWFLPLALASGTLIVQSHIGTIPVVGGMFLLAMILYFYHVMRQGLAQTGELKAPLWTSTVIVLLLWAPPIYEAIIVPDIGNLGAILRAFLTSHETKGIARSLHMLSWFYTVPFADVVHINKHLALGLFTLSPLLFLKTYDRPHRLLYLFTLLSSLITVVAATRIFVPPQQYLISYFYTVAACMFYLLFAGIVLSLERRFTHLPLLKAPVVALLLSVAIVFLRFPVDAGSKVCKINSEVDSVIAEIPLERHNRYRLIISEPSAPYSLASALTLELVRRGYNICFDDSWRYRFGAALTCTYQRKRPIPADQNRSITLSTITSDTQIPENSVALRTMLIEW